VSAWPGSDDVAIPGQIFALGRVSNRVSDIPAASERSDWAQGWDAIQKTVTANTGELHWDYGQKIIEVRAASSQGVVGFAGGKTFALPALTISVTTPFVSLLVTALDGRTIDTSQKVLVTAVAREKWTGSEIEGVGEGARLNTLGGPPLLLEPVQASLRFNIAFDSAEALDLHGRRRQRPMQPASDGSYSLDGRYATAYYLFERIPPPPPPPPAAPETHDEPPATGCGCQGGGDAVSPWLWMTLLGFLACRRRRSVDKLLS
jgi:hypothetical protein